jgi:prophage regulatory protein
MALMNSCSLRPKDAAELLGIGHSTLWRWVKNKDGFPQPVKLSPGVSVFDQAELVAYRNSKRQVSA